MCRFYSIHQSALQDIAEGSSPSPERNLASPECSSHRISMCQVLGPSLLYSRIASASDDDSI